MPSVYIHIFSVGAPPTQSKDVLQTPGDVLGGKGEEATLTCKHRITSYDTVLWFHRRFGDNALNLVGFTSYTSVQNVEQPYIGYFKLSGNGEAEASLHLLKMRHPEDSGHYLCAAFSRTAMEKPQIPLQKPLSDPVHLWETTFVQFIKQWVEQKK